MKSIKIRGVQFAGFALVQVSDIASQRRGLRLQLCVHLQVVAATDRLRDRVADHHGTVATHQRRGFIGQGAGKRGAQFGRSHQHVGVACELTDFERCCR